MKLSKQNCWFAIQVVIVAYLIISGCMEPSKPSSSEEVLWPNRGKLTIKVQHPVSNSAIKNISFSKASGHLEWPDAYLNDLFFINYDLTGF